MRWLSVIMFIGVSVSFYGCTKEEKGDLMSIATPGEIYISKIIERLEHSENILDEISRAADETALKIIRGGRIYVTDDETIFRSGEEKTVLLPGGNYYYPMHEDWGGFVAEACDRAGGLRHIQPVPVKGKLSENDVVLAGTLELDPDSQLKQLKPLKDSGVLLIIFGSRGSKVAVIADYLIDNGLEPGIVPVMDIGKDNKIGPIAGVANVINMWAFTSELVAALTRQGKMPTLWQSMFVPGAAPRNERIGAYMFHPDMNIAPIEAGKLGRQYVMTVKGFLENIKKNELSRFHDAGKLCAGAISGDKKVIASLIGHFMVSQRRMPGYPNIFILKENLYGDEQLQGILEKDDIWLHVGYSYYPVRELNYARKVGAKTICVFTPGPTDIGEGYPVAEDMSLIDVYIDPYWKHGDAVVEVPGYDIRIIPPSGVVMITCYWMIIGETLGELQAVSRTKLR